MRHVSRRRFLQASGAFAGAGLIGEATLGTPLLPGRDGQAMEEVRLAFTGYERFMPLATGDVAMASPRLTWVRGPRSEMLARAASDPHLHGGEGSMLGHLLRVAEGDDSLAAVPVFLLRNFTARDLYTRRGAELAPDRLDGHRVGIYNWAASGAVWYRHLVRYLGQDPYAIEWVVGRADTPDAVTSRVPLPSHVRYAPPGRSLTDMLLAGDIDAFFAPGVPRRYDPDQGPIVRVVPDFRSLEKQYFRDTGCYPPQHALLLRKGILDEAPSIGTRLLETFQECEGTFMAAQALFPYATPWMMEDLEDTLRFLGSDYHLHGLERNRHAMETFLQSAYDDRMTDRLVTVEEYFREFRGG